MPSNIKVKSLRHHKWIRPSILKPDKDEDFTVRQREKKKSKRKKMTIINVSKRYCNLCKNLAIARQQKKLKLLTKTQFPDLNQCIFKKSGSKTSSINGGRKSLIVEGHLFHS